MISGETVSNASRERKNGDRTLDSDERMKIGKKVDGVLLGHPQLQYVVMEGCKDDVEYYDKKGLEDHHDLVRTMHDMLLQINERIGSNKATELGVQIIGMIERGSKWSIYGLQQKGYICVLRRHLDSHMVVASQFDDVESVIEAMKWALRIKIHVQKTQKAVVKAARASGRHRKRNVLQPVLVTPKAQRIKRLREGAD